MYWNRDAIKEKIKRTESVKRGANDHESVALTLAQSRVILVRDFVRRHKKTKTKDADQDTLFDRKRSICQIL